MVFVRSSKTLILALLAISIPALSAATVPITIAPTGHALVPVSGPFGQELFVFDTGLKAPLSMQISPTMRRFRRLAGRHSRANRHERAAAASNLQSNGGWAHGGSVGRHALRSTGRQRSSAGCRRSRHVRSPSGDFNLPAKQLTLMPTGTPPVAG